MTRTLPERVGSVAVGVVGGLVGAWLVPQLTIGVAVLTDRLGRVIRDARA